MIDRSALYRTGGARDAGHRDRVIDGRVPLNTMPPLSASRACQPVERPPPTTCMTAGFVRS